MDSGTKIALGVGCGCVGLLVVAGGATGVFLMGRPTATSDMVPYPDGPPQIDVPLGVPPVASGEPRDDAFAAYVNGAATAAHAAVRGTPYDARWNGADPAHDLRAVDPSTRAQLDALGPAQQIVVTVIELEATDGTSRVRSNVAVFPDGRVRWAKVTRDTIPTTPTPNLATLAPALSSEANRMLETLAGTCDLPTLSPTDVPIIPANVQADILRDASQIPGACAPGTSAVNWQPKVDDVTIVLSGNGQVAMVRTQLETNGTAIFLGSPQVRPVP